MKLHEIQNKLLSSNVKAFSSLEFRRLLKLTRISSKKLIERYVKMGAIIRFKRNLYALKIAPPSKYVIANKLYGPSYISFETALSYYNIIPEIVHSFTSATTRLTRNFEVENTGYSYHTIKRSAYTGYKLATLENEDVLIAEKEKALADYLYFVFLKKKAMNDRIKTKEISKNRLLHFVSLFGKRNFTRWVKDVIRTTT